jgi:hypothetical protein
MHPSVQENTLMSDSTHSIGAAASRFSPGRLLITPGALELLSRCQVEPLTLLQRHLSGDWGELCPEDAEANEDALRSQLRVISGYVIPPPESAEPSLTPARVWVITEADRSATTILLPEEY